MNKQMSKITILLTAFLVLVLIVPACFSGEKINLKLKLKEGKTYNQRITTEQEMSQDVMGMKQDVNQTITMGIALKVEKIDPSGDMNVKVTFSSIKLQQKSPIGLFEYDSTKPPAEENPLTKVFSSMIGKGVTATITPDGTTKEIKGFDELASKILDSSGSTQGQEKDMIAKTLDENFGDEAVQGMLSNMTGSLPDKPIGIGESWTDKTVITEKFPMIISQTHTLKDIKDGKAIISTTGTIKPNPDGEAFVMEPMTMHMDLAGENHGTIEIDLKTGLTVGGEMKQDITGKLIMTGIPEAEEPKKDEEGKEKKPQAAATPESLSFPITVKSVTKFEIF